ncbi:hypothetical protein LCL96_15240 [Rossellomorea aquimaris]|uniref:hypothetical protein n=1 Tax=Rossellomorea aquimaris TaxID=189382 RepID=UPI001CD35A80|nr:hypothetical protein [Rossellomorea aquimaris]MCA1060292.1 hypothetical protein [Rossellomorea aquimaris]
MAKLIKKIDGKKAYLGLLTPQELEESNKMQEYLETFIPALEERLNNKYKQRVVAYAYEFGTELRKLVEQFNIKGIQEKIFWDQIRDFASNDEGRPKDRGNRKIYDYYYKLSFYHLEDIQNVNWGEWSQLFDTKEVVKEERIIKWMAIKAKNNKIPREPFRLFVTGVRLFVKDKDTLVFSDKQLFEKYDMIFGLTSLYLELYEKFFTKQNRQPTEARLKQKKKYQEKYFKEAFLHRRKEKGASLKSISENVFKKVYLLNEE